MAAPCISSSMGSKKATTMVAIGVILVLMGLSHVEQADAQTPAPVPVPIINLSGVALNVTARVNANIVGSVVVNSTVNVTLPVPLNEPVVLIFINLRTGATGTITLTFNATTSIVIAPGLPPTSPPLPTILPVNVLLFNLNIFVRLLLTL